MARVIALANQKGGVGKTTTAVNLSASLAALGHDTLLIDMDPQANASSGLGVTRDKAGRNVYHVLIEGASIQEVAQQGPVSRLSVVPSHMDLYGAELELIALDDRERRLAAAIARLEKKYAFIFIDCPPSLGLLTLNSLVAAHSLLIPMPCEYYALEGLSLLVNTMERLRLGMNNRLALEGVVVTMFDGRSNLAQQVLEEVKKHFREQVFQTLIPRNVRLAEAPGFGVPAFMHDRTSAGAMAYTKLASEILGKHGFSMSALPPSQKPERPSAALAREMSINVPPSGKPDAPEFMPTKPGQSVIMSSTNGGYPSSDDEKHDA